DYYCMIWHKNVWVF
nr:immunoglobulin light chain junction region [Macaca mulatta]MOY08703.1 immunoglobulin light chain junction region [Macaca mulatta]MOY08778.1 immunoglobulin light chain junction region [Macaca mulatta]MOY10215.1 immunoglobulin light chain junction region [Macaca mulatta]